METEDRTRTRWPLPQRSAADRKLGGVAGGLGRAWRIDPILIRVAFVVLTLFGGSGIALYCAGWLLMRGDGDDASALESLAGRGHSSVSPALTVVLIVVGLASMGSVFSWGIPFWPVLIGAIVLIVILSNRRRAWGGPRGPRQGPHGPWGGPHRDPSQWADDFAARASAWGRDFGDRAARWGREMGDRGCSGGASATQTAEAPTAQAAEGGTEAAEAYAESAPDGPATDNTDGQPARSPEPEDLLTEGRTPPAWDPLGAAPFAWDLPDPTAPQQAAMADAPATTRGRPKPGSAIARVFLGLALITGSLLTAGIATQRTGTAWSAAAGITLGVLALGMLIAALRGRGARLLVGPGVFLAVLTLALTVTGLQGTSGFGGHTWAPTSADDVQSQYFWNAGDVTLDLSGVQVPPGKTIGTDVTVGAGRATVILPADVAVTAQCSATAGDIDCLGQRADGLRPQALVDRAGSRGAGTLEITVHSNAGQAVLQRP